jgi:hypothetical protein
MSVSSDKSGSMKAGCALRAIHEIFANPLQTGRRSGSSPARRSDRNRDMTHPSSARYARRQARAAVLSRSAFGPIDFLALGALGIAALLMLTAL